MAKTDTFQCSVVTPERAVLECDARFVSFPAHDGEIGIMRGRSPLLCQVGIGYLRAETGEGETTLFVDGGFAQMIGDKLTILTEQAKDPSEIDRSAAQSLLQEAQAMSTRTSKDFEARQSALGRAREMLRGPKGAG